MHEASARDFDLQPLPYQRRLRDYFTAREPQLWNGFVGDMAAEEQAAALRFDLLKSTYRVAHESQPALYRAARQAADSLQLDVPLTIYQAQNPQGLNASLAYSPDHAHIVLEGPLSSKLSELELASILAHELGHFCLWHHWNHDYRTVHRILTALVEEPDADACYAHTARLFDLYSEIFCDRCALRHVGDPLPVISTLVKIETQVDQVDAASYLRQAHEIFTQVQPAADDVTHPAVYIRARAIGLWQDDKSATRPSTGQLPGHLAASKCSPIERSADAEVKRMIEGQPQIDLLDLLAQQDVVGWTRQLLDTMLSAAWMQTDALLAHARSFFPDYQPPSDEATIRTIATGITSASDSLLDYFCYLMLDLVTADRNLEELPLALAIELSEALSIKPRFREIAIRELRLRKRQFEKIDRAKERLLAAAG